MHTTHQIFFENAKSMQAISSESVDLVVTSPPYPMIQMWDELFVCLNPAIADALNNHNGMAAFELMHSTLELVWCEIFRILRSGGMACVNIGDAVRTMGDSFALYPNHVKVLSQMQGIGFTTLPQILWRKQTNAPNKFMGSGMLPPYAYVTLEHEHILVMRKGSRKAFNSSTDKDIRRESAYFWEERNNWFSDVWMELKGTRQQLIDNSVRKRSAAFPFEIPYRLINMFSVKGDTIVDPFLGTGTTMIAAMAAGRHSVGFELEPEFTIALSDGVSSAVDIANIRINDRLEAHLEFVKTRTDAGYEFKYLNRHYGFPVMTRQEIELLFNRPLRAKETEKRFFRMDYASRPLPKDYYRVDAPVRPATSPRSKRSSKRSLQRELFED